MQTKLQSILQKAKFDHFQALVDSPHLQEEVRVEPLVDQPFHSASVGKLMTAVVIIRAIEQAKLRWDQPIIERLEHAVLEGLFTDVSVVTVAMLLSHTSGVNDYFTGKYSNKETFVDRVVHDQDRMYQPMELIEFTKRYQTPVAAPGKKFFYSDTGYVLLGLLAEMVYQRPLHEIYRQEIFDSLEMNRTGLLFYDPITDAKTLAPVMVQNANLKLANSLSIDWGGGGLQTTLTDLLRFLRGLFQGKLVSNESLQTMTRATHHFEAGMYYGMGMMELRFEKFFFLLKGLPRYYGHSGILGVHAWIEPQSGNIIIMNVSSMKKMVSSFRVLISIVQTLHKRKQ